MSIKMLKKIMCIHAWAFMDVVVVCGEKYGFYICQKCRKKRVKNLKTDQDIDICTK